MSGFNWGLTPSGKKDGDEPEVAATPEPMPQPEPVEDDPFAIFRTPAAPTAPEPDDLPPTEAMPTSQEPYRPAPAAPVEPPATPFVFQPPPVAEPIPLTPQSWQSPAPIAPIEQPPVAPPVPPAAAGPTAAAPTAYQPPPFRPPSQYPQASFPVSQHPSATPPAASTQAFPSTSGHAASATPGIDDIFGESSFRDYEDGALIAPLPRRREADAPRGPRAPLTQVQRILIGVAAGLVAAIVLVLVFVLGTNLPGLVPAAASQPTASAPAPEPVKTTSAPLTGTLPPGVYAWDALNGGECVDPFTSAWETEFTVVDCGQSHAAQLVAKGAFDDATFPGADKLAKEAGAACVSSKVIDYSTAATYDDLQLATSYATTQAEWDKGFTSYYCFVNRPDRQIDGNLSKVTAAAN